MCGEPFRASPARENQWQRRAFISTTEKTKDAWDIFRATTLLSLVPRHWDLDLVLFFGLSNDLTAMNQHVVLEKRIQRVPQELLILTECPGGFEIGSHLLTDVLQKTPLETPETSQNVCGVLRMVANYVCLVRRLQKLANRPTIAGMNPTVCIPNHHEFDALFIQGQEAVHHENGTRLHSVTKNSLGKL